LQAEDASSSATEAGPGEFQAVKAAIIGCGKVGQKRARSLPGAQLVACADAFPEKAAALAATSGAEALPDWRAVVDRKDVELIIVAATHDALAPVTLAAVRAGKHVLVEKPGARRAAELKPVLAAARQTGAKVRVGFNHRFHPALRKAKELWDAGAAGEALFLRGRYGHGGRLGYEKEWRADPKLSGGGELIDQGIHLIDLARWFLGDISEVQGLAGTWFWKMPVEDNAFLVLRTAAKRVAFLHASCTEWKNLFSLEVYGREGKLEVSGLGGSYGTEKLIFHRMLPEMGPPETTVWEYPGEDQSWGLEFAEFLEDLRLGREPSPGIADAQAALRVVETVYRRCRL
jgi:predicted dehydrogenase